MKRFVTLVAAAALIMGLAATASAELAVKAAGAWRVHGNVLQNFGDFDDDTSSTGADTFTVQHRARTQLRFAYNENVMAELYTQYGNVTWGQGAAAYGATSSAAGSALLVKRAFIQFRWPDSDVLISAGEQDITFPSSGAFSNMVLGGDDGSAIAVSTPITDMIGLTVAYARLAEVAAPTSGNDADAFLAAVPLSLDGMTIAPWFSYGIIGQNSGLNSDDETANVWWAGAGFNMDMLDPIVIYADFVYGSADDGFGGLDDGTSGWLADAMVEFKGLDFAVLQGFGAYSSQNDDGDGAMPIIQSDWGIGGTLIWGSAFTTDISAATPGFWLAGVAARQITFIEKLSHDVIALYAQGTADSSGDADGDGVADNAGVAPVALTADDSYWEVDFNTRYQIYESLAAIVELAYADYDLDTGDTDPLMKAAFGFQYNF
ncbi:outer membrane homotrimeric porin [Desulfocurvibacter africanus]|uniref:outer membrane homotrimeric porin n=1 Tax=Desulfocurvibacter africanus TaxID=873 RepID=UPI000421F381|nr:outer membrane homotrimeric porin [Desulfocurvibacter africanus]